MAETIDKQLLKNDLYHAVNADWIKDAKIPNDHASTGSFMDLNDNIDKQLMHDFDDMMDDDISLNQPTLFEFFKLYDLANNFKKRDQDGNAPLLPYLKRITELKSFKELNDQLADWTLTGLPLPFSYSVDQDMKNTQVNTLYAEVPGLFLPDRTYYENDNPAYQQLMPIFTKMAVELLKLADYGEDEANQIIADAKKFDALIAPHVKSAEEAADYSKIYNPMPFADFIKFSDHIDLNELAQQLFKNVPEQIIVSEPKYYQALNQIMNPDTFDLMKSWMLVKVVNRYANYLSEDFRQANNIYSQALSGKKTATPQKKSAFYLATGVFNQTVGDYYAQKYFGEKAKADVEQMVVSMINVYKSRLITNEWIGKATKEKAILKLDSLELQVGYPDKIDKLEYKFKVKPASDGGNLLDNIINFTKISREDSFDQLDKPVDRKKWEMSASTVNAYYHPFKNIIVFPAAILQAPFYSLDQTPSQNYGGIGAVIAHEISHAFDNNGSLFDELGNLNNWWTKEDHQHFTELSKQMIKEFDGLPFAGGKVNGKLTVSENIADAGGLVCALEAAKGEEDYDLYEFFTNWAKIWRNKSTQQYQELLLSVDVHAPAELRANVQVKNLDDFYTTFNVQPGDGMYLEPSQRVKIW